MSETVWAIHNFEAEAQDEISFNIGEPIIVLQKDELYQDGWWERTTGHKLGLGTKELVQQQKTQRAHVVLSVLHLTLVTTPSKPCRRRRISSELHALACDPPGQTQAEAPLRAPNIYGSNDNIANNGQQGGNMNAGLITSSNHNNNSNVNSNTDDAKKVVAPQQNHSSVESSVSQMHIQQNPNIASPSMGSTRGGYGGTLSSTPSNATSNSKFIGQSVDESLNDPQLSGHPSTWSIDQVAHWLRLCGFGGVVPSFVENEISGAILLELNLNNLKELDITSFGKRFNIMNAITSLKQNTKTDMVHKGLYGTMSNPSSIYGVGPNIPPRMTSAPITAPSPRASFDLRGDYLRDPRQELMDPRSTPVVHQHPATTQPLNMRPQQQQQHSDYEMQSNVQQVRVAALNRADTIGSVLSGASMGDYPTAFSDVNTARGVQRQSITSAYSSNSNPNRSQWDRSAPRPPQLPSPVASQQRGVAPLNEYDETSFHGRALEHPSMGQFPRAMEVNGPTGPQMHHQDSSYMHEIYQQPIPKQRKYHNPDNTNRPANGKADPNDKVVPLELIGKPDYAGWLKKRGDTYRTWKNRWFMLKGVTLYYMNSPKDNASKDYINLIGYKIIQDENIYAGKYCFKAVHEELRNFFFYTESESDMKGWLKALMKVTIGRDPTAPVISSSNIPTIPLHVARQLAPRPPSPSRRSHGVGTNGQPMHPQQQQNQQQYDQRYHQQQQQQQQLQQQQKSYQQQLLDYGEQESDGDNYLANEFTSPRANYNQNGGNSSVGGMLNDRSQNQTQPESPILKQASTASQQQQQQRHSFVHPDHQNGDDDPWRDEDGEGFSQTNTKASSARNNTGYSNSNDNNNRNDGGLQRQQPSLAVRPDSELDSFQQHTHEAPARESLNARWTQEQYVAWMNLNLPSSVDAISDMTQSLRSGVVLVRLIEKLSGELVDKRIPNATYTLQMLENLLTAFKFMDRVGVSTDGYTVKDIFNGNEDKIVLMLDSIRARFPNGSEKLGSTLPVLSSPPSSDSLTIGNPSGGFSPGLIQSPKGTLGGNSPALSQEGKIGNGDLTQEQPQQQQQQRIQPQRTGGSEFEALYDEAARSTVA
ncbi:polar growth protein [Mortierella sp. GBA30]|nr:polar growth protein [Mortierella sp. GBA30]